ncbi:hypothetical protein AHAS_Ahas02G0002600 [Arachis hypogaea]
MLCVEACEELRRFRYLESNITALWYKDPTTEDSENNLKMLKGEQERSVIVKDDDLVTEVVDDEVEIEFQNAESGKHNEGVSGELLGGGGQIGRGIGIMNSKWLDNQFKKKVESNPRIKIKELVAKAYKKWNLTVTKSMAVKTKQKALSQIQGI